MHSSGELDTEQALTQRILAVFRRWREDLPFEEVARQYRQVKDEFVALAGDDEVRVADTKRSVNNHLLIHAEATEQPHDVCHAIWEEIVQLGFWNIDIQYSLSSSYVRCCQFNGEFEAGLAVLEPLIAQIEQWLRDPTIKPELRTFWERFLARDHEIRDDLKAGIHERLMPMSRPLTPEKIAFTQRMNAVRYRERRDDLSFEEAVREYRQIEAEFVQRARDDEFQVVETKRRVTESILRSAYETEQPHDVCRSIWEEVLQRGFSNEERRHDTSETYVQCCLFNQQPAAGLAVVEPFLAELQHQVDTGTDDDMPAEKYPEEIARLTKLRDELKALQK